MIVVDTSVLVCTLLREPDAGLFEELLVAAEVVVPVSCFVETSLVLRKRPRPHAHLAAFLDEAGIRLLGSDERQAHLAAEADRRYGRGTGHPARLNFGDCLAYAAAVANDAPLLFKGDDFAHTDVRCAI